MTEARTPGKFLWAWGWSAKTCSQQAAPFFRLERTYTMWNTSIPCFLPSYECNVTSCSDFHTVIEYPSNGKPFFPLFLLQIRFNTAEDKKISFATWRLVTQIGQSNVLEVVAKERGINENVLRKILINPYKIYTFTVRQTLAKDYV